MNKVEQDLESVVIYDVMGGYSKNNEQHPARTVNRNTNKQWMRLKRLKMGKQLKQKPTQDWDAAGLTWLYQSLLFATATATAT